MREYHKKTKPRYAARNQVRRAKKLKASPKWGDKYGIEFMYKMAYEIGWEVDHIVPLNHSEVCGMHVLNNLQLIPKYENQVKGNKFDGTKENKAWTADLF